MIKFWRWPPKSTNDKIYFGFLFFAIVASTLSFFSNKEGFLNMEKKYKKVYKKINYKLESMINYLPNLNFKNNIRRLKRKYI